MGMLPATGEVMAAPIPVFIGMGGYIRQPIRKIKRWKLFAVFFTRFYLFVVVEMRNALVILFS